MKTSSIAWSRGSTHFSVPLVVALLAVSLCARASLAGLELAKSASQPPRPPAHPSAIVIREFSGHADGVLAVAISPDERLLASGSADRTARIWDIATARPVHVLTGHQEAITSIAFSGDGKRLVTGSPDHTARVWDVQSGALIAILQGHRAHVHCLDISRDGRTVVTGSCDGTLRIWDVDAETTTQEIPQHAEVRGTLGLSPDGQRVVVSIDLFGQNGGRETTSELRVYDVKSGTLVHTLKPNCYVSKTGYDADGRAIYYTSLTSPVHQDVGRFDATSFEPMKTQEFPSGAQLMLLSGDGSRLVCAQRSVLKCMNAKDGRPVRYFAAGSPRVNALACSTDGRWIAAASGGRGDVYGNGPRWESAGDNVIVLCDLSAKPPSGLTLTVPGVQHISTLIPSRDRRVGMLVGSDGMAHLFDMTNGREVQKVPALLSACLPDFSHDGKEVVTRRPDGKGVAVYEVGTGRRVFDCDTPNDLVTSVGFLADGKSIVLGTTPQTQPAKPDAPPATSGRLRLLDLSADPATYAEAPSIEVKGLAPRNLAVSSNGKWLAIADPQLPARHPNEPCEVVLFDMATKQEVRRIKQSLVGRMLHVDFTPDGRRLVVVGRTSQVIDPETGKNAIKIDGLPQAQFEFSPDGKELLTLGFPACLWDLTTGKLKAMARDIMEVGGPGVMLNVSYLPDGRPCMVFFGTEQAMLVPLEFP